MTQLRLKVGGFLGIGELLREFGVTLARALRQGLAGSPSRLY
ncbi:MAG: hypothetical protein AAFX85_17110 [Pseudomonadota bacterium]